MGFLIPPFGFAMWSIGVGFVYDRFVLGEGEPWTIQDFLVVFFLTYVARVAIKSQTQG